MIGISIREFARRDGCNEKLVRRAIKEKKLSAHEDGSLDPKLVGTAWRQTNRRSAPADKSADKSAPVRTAADDGRQTVTRDAPVPGGPTENELRDFIDRIMAGTFLAEVDAIRVKENALALKHLLDGRKKAGELIDAQAAETVLFEEFRSARDAWLNFPSRVGPLIAAEVGIEPDKLVEALSAHVHQQLTDLGEPEADFGAAEEPAENSGAPRVDAPAQDQRP